MPDRNRFWFEADGKWHNIEGVTVDPSSPPPPPPEDEPLYAGHIPYILQIGMNAAENTSTPQLPPRPQYNEARTILGGDAGSIRRVFDYGNWISVSRANSMVAECDADNQTAWMSFKVPGDRWDLLIAGNYDSDLEVLRNWAIARRTAGKNPVLCTIHHEPNGNGPLSTVVANMELWGKLQMYALNYMTGWASRGISNSGGTYNASEDVRDIMPWSAIANGFWWGTKTYYPDRIAAAFPTESIAAFRDRGGPIASDVYDPPPNTPWPLDANNDRIESQLQFNTNYDRCWREIQTMVTWARANNVKCIGFGEMGNVTQANYDATINQLMDNRDIVTVACIFNNFANSRWDWVHKPANYPAYNGTNSRGVTDLGGDALSASYITKFQNLLYRSQTETGPF